MGADDDRDQSLSLHTIPVFR